MRADPNGEVGGAAIGLLAGADLDSSPNDIAGGGLLNEAMFVPGI